MASIFCLPKQDVLFPCIFAHLDVAEIWRLRAVCKLFKSTCEEYFRVCQSVDLRPWSGLLSQFVGPFCRILRICESLQRFYMKGDHSGLLPRPKTSSPNHDMVLVQLAKSLSIITGAPQLRVLHLEQVDLQQPRDCLQGLGACCSNLRELYIVAVSRFSDETLTLLTRNCSTLTRLTIRHTQVRGQSLCPLLARCPHLEYLCVAYSFFIESVFLEDALRQCSVVLWVDLRHLEVVSDRTLQILLEYCKGLRKLQVEGCSRVSGKMLSSLRESGVELDVPHQPIGWRVPAQI